jgi:hypothetical protein
MIPYHQLPGLQSVYLEDSYVTEIVETPDRLAFDLDAVLTEDHPLYQAPAPGEQYCYRPAQLIFPNVRRVSWLEHHLRPSTDAAGEVDYGNIDVFYKDDDTYHLEGDWGTVEVVSDPPVLVVREGAQGRSEIGERDSAPPEAASS